MLKYRIWSKSSKCYTHDPAYPGSSLHCASNYYLNQDGNLVDFITTIGGDPDNATKGPIDQDDYVVEMCTGFTSTDGKLLYVNDYVEFKLGLKIVRGKIVYNCFRFWIYEMCGGCIVFTEQQYTLIGNHNINPDALNTKRTEESEHKGGH